ncbi:insulin-like peptide 3 [Musca autumnalis]|uniref:insulin-like peptide 3 n=1 Tax=Musca autumnalis TaxID=221902 RepID=UPI003CE87760
MKLLAALIFFAICSEIQSAATRFCGQNLVRILEAACVDGFNGMQISKKSINKPMHTQIVDFYGLNNIEDETHDVSDSHLSDIFFSDAVNGLAKTRRQRHLHGVYDECCRKGCTYNELLGYCL